MSDRLIHCLYVVGIVSVLLFAGCNEIPAQSRSPLPKSFESR